MTKEKKEALLVFLHQAKGLFEPAQDMATMSDRPGHVKTIKDILYLHDKAIAELQKEETNEALFEKTMNKIQKLIETLQK
jgi:arginyl-tRNA synthetase